MVSRMGLPGMASVCSRRPTSRPTLLTIDAAHAVDAHQLLVVLLFEARFADDVAGIVAAVARFDLIGADFAHVTAGVGHESAARIAAAMHHEHFQHGNIGAMRFDKGDVAGRGFRLDDDGLEMRQRFGGLELLLHVVERQVPARRRFAAAGARLAADRRAAAER